MTWPTDVDTPSPDGVARAIRSAVNGMVVAVRAWRGSINTSGLMSATTSRENYTLICNTRKTMNDNKGVTGLAAEIKAQLSNASPTFDPTVEFVNVKTAMDTFVAWFQSNWPKTAGNNPSFDTYDVTTGLLTDYSVTLSAPQKTTVLANIDALLAAFS